MAKRTDGAFERRERDFYATPIEPLKRLMPFLGDMGKFAEPMCGDGAIVRGLEGFGWTCSWVSDIAPQDFPRAEKMDVLDLDESHVEGCTHIVSNPPWPLPPRLRKGVPPGEPTVSIIRHLMALRPTWLLLSADFAHNDYAVPLMRRCRQIVTARRVKWIADSDHSGLDNCAWYLFREDQDGLPEFFNVERPVVHGPALAAFL